MSEIQEGKGKSRNFRLSGFLVSLAVLLVTVLLLGLIETNGGSVRVSRCYGTFTNGLKYSYLTYIQKDASDEDPRPAVVVFHGANDNAQGFSGWAIELSRRGYNVFVPDLNATGMSDWGFADDNYALTQEFIEMVMDLPYVDADAVVCSGHSKGGMYTDEIMKKMDIAGGICVGSVPMDMTDTSPREGNIAFISAYGDEKNRFDDPDSSLGKRLSQFTQLYFGLEEMPELDTVYGSVETNNYRILSIYKGFLSNHSAERYSSSVVEFVCQHAELFASTDTTLASDNLIYQWYYLLSLIGMMAFAISLVFLFLALVKLPFFVEVQRAIPENIANTGAAWVSSAAMSMLPGIPLFLVSCWTVKKGTNWLDGTAFLPVANLNRFVLFLLLLGIYEILLFYFVFYRPRKLSMEICGLAWEGGRKENSRKMGKTILLGSIVAGIGVLFLYLLDAVAGIAFTSWWMSLRAPSLERLKNSLGYILVVIPLFIGVQFGGNITRRLKNSGNIARDMIRDILVNCLVSGLLISIMFFFNMWCNSQQIWLELFEGINTYYFYNFMLVVCMVQTINTILYRKIGTIWPGVVICTVLFGILLPAGYPVKFY